MNTDAEAARSILACAAEIEIAVDGEPLVLDGTPLGLHDQSGSPTFVCGPDSPLARAGLLGSQVSLSVASDLHEDDSLLLTGWLRCTTVDTCACCDAGRAMVTVELSHVLLMRPRICTPIDVHEFCDPALQLNPGFLRRTEQHLNEAHGDHLRAAVARLTEQHPRAIVGVQVRALSPVGVQVQWVTAEGAHVSSLTFNRAARNADELGEALRRALHAQIC